MSFVPLRPASGEVFKPTVIDSDGSSTLITGSVGLAGVDAAFKALGDPEVHAKILVDPSSDATQPLARV